MVKTVNQVQVANAGVINPNYTYNGQSSTGDDLNELDLVARNILAVTHSAWKAVDNPILQNITGMKTFACIASGDTLYVAHNAGLLKPRNLLPADVEADAIRDAAIDIMREDNCNKITTVTVINLATKKNAKSYHAEMQLIAYCIANGLPIDGGIIGVSKPCCSQCSDKLSILHVEHSLKAGPPIGGWEIPGGDFGGILTVNTRDPLRH